MFARVELRGGHTGRVASGQARAGRMWTILSAFGRQENRDPEKGSDLLTVSG